MSSGVEHLDELLRNAQTALQMYKGMSGEMGYHKPDRLSRYFAHDTQSPFLDLNDYFSRKEQERVYDQVRAQQPPLLIPPQPFSIDPPRRDQPELIVLGGESSQPQQAGYGLSTELEELSRLYDKKRNLRSLIQLQMDKGIVPELN